MKILWVKTDFLHPATKGGHIRTLGVLERLHARHEIHYVAFAEPDRPDGPRRSVEYCSRAYPLPHAIPRKDSPAFLGQLAARLFSNVPVAIGRYRSAAMERQIEALLAEHRFDCLVCDFLAPTPNIARIREWMLFQHNVETTIWQRRAEHAPDPLRKLYLRQQARRMLAYEGRVCREAGHVIAVSRPDAELMRTQFGVSSLSIVPTGVDVDYFSPPPSAPKTADLVFVGSMDWLPNIDGVSHFVREILPLIRRHRPECTVAIVGRTPTKAVAALAEADRRILVTGTVGDVRPYLWGSTISIVPLRIGGGTRLKIYEAMAAGVPVVSTTVGAEGLEVSSPENIRLAEGPEEFAGACGELLAQGDLRARQAQAARELVRSRFSWNSVAESFEALLRQYGRAAGGPRPRAIDVVHELERGDLEAACALLSSLSVSFAGVVSPSLSRAICEDALHHGDPVILLAKKDGALAGVVLAIRNSARFWKGFALRHPLLALHVARHRVMRDRRGADHRTGKRAPGIAEGGEDGPSWSDTGAQVAKVLFIGVAPGHRRAGAAERMYVALLERLRADGFRRIDARIDPDNVASIRLHEATGWKLHSGDGVVLATRTLA